MKLALNVAVVVVVVGDDDDDRCVVMRMLLSAHWCWWLVNWFQPVDTFHWAMPSVTTEPWPVSMLGWKKLRKKDYIRKCTMNMIFKDHTSEVRKVVDRVNQLNSIN